MKPFTFEVINYFHGNPVHNYKPLQRAKVPGGWLILWTYNEHSIAFIPDPTHSWDGGSLP